MADRYVLERELGAGGMATVFLAQDPRHQRKVAIKILRPELAAFIGPERFLKEIETTASLQHPHILPLFDSGRVESTVFYVMPYVQGESLRSRLDRESQLPVADAIRIATDIAGALDYAHRQGVIHRDIKPDNVLFHDGRALVADFGIALAWSQGEAGMRMTRSGVSLGTPQYMSPEQASGEHQLDPRTDVFALGVVLYEMLTGQPPFTGATVPEVFARVIADEVTPVVRRRKSVPPHVAAAVERALEKLPADRWQTAAQFAEALAGAGGATVAGRRGTRASLRHSAVPWALSAGLLLVLGWVGLRHGADAASLGRTDAVQHRARSGRGAHLYPDRAPQPGRPAALHDRHGQPAGGGPASPVRPAADGGDRRGRTGRPGDRQQPAVRVAGRTLDRVR